MHRRYVGILRQSVENGFVMVYTDALHGTLRRGRIRCVVGYVGVG